MEIDLKDFSGTRAFIKLILRRDRIILPVLLIFLIFLFISIAYAYVFTYSEAALREAMVLEITSNPGSVAFLGSIWDSSIGGLVAWRSSVIGPILVALVGIFFMVRHTRSEERKGRLELLNSTAVGRHALLTSALLTTYGFNIILGGVIVLSLIFFGLSWEGSIAMALSMTLFGCLFASITGVAGQLTDSSNDARYISLGLLIAFFLIRIIGWDDGEIAWLSWFSPFGWVHHLHAFADEEWLILGLFIIFTIILGILAYYLSYNRDMGHGIFPQRKGSGRASITLNNVMGLTWRLQRKNLFFWLLSFSVMGIILGQNAQTVTNVFNDSPQLMNILSQIGGTTDPLDNYITMILLLLGQVFAIYGMATVLKLRSEEIKKHSEFILTNTVSRSRWISSNLFFALIGPSLVLLVFILTYALSYSFISGNMMQDLVQLICAALVYLPAIWVMVGISLLLFGLVPRLTSLSWVILAFFFIINFLADLLDLNQLIRDISPFTHVPNLLIGGNVGWVLVLMLFVSFFLAFMGILGYRQRDIT